MFHVFLLLHFYSCHALLIYGPNFKSLAHQEVSLKSITKFHSDRHTRKRVNKNMVKNLQKKRKILSCLCWRHFQFHVSSYSSPSFFVTPSTLVAGADRTPRTCLPTPLQRALKISNTGASKLHIQSDSALMLILSKIISVYFPKYFFCF